MEGGEVPSLSMGLALVYRYSIRAEGGVGHPEICPGRDSQTPNPDTPVGELRPKGVSELGEVANV